MRRLSSLLNDSPSELVARHAYLPATLRVTFCNTKLLSLFMVLVDEFRLRVKPCEKVTHTLFGIPVIIPHVVYKVNNYNTLSMSLKNTFNTLTICVYVIK